MGVNWNPAYQHVQIAFTQTAKVLSCIVQNGVENIGWGGGALASQAHVASQLAVKQNLLNFQTETNASGILDQSDETATTPVFITNWIGTAVNNSGYQTLTIGGVQKLWVAHRWVNYSLQV